MAPTTAKIKSDTSVKGHRSEFHCLEEDFFLYTVYRKTIWTNHMWKQAVCLFFYTSSRIVNLCVSREQFLPQGRQLTDCNQRDWILLSPQLVYIRCAFWWESNPEHFPYQKLVQICFAHLKGLLEERNKRKHNNQP